MRGNRVKIVHPLRDVEPEWWGREDPAFLRCLWHTVTPGTVGARHLWAGFEIIGPGRAGLMHSHPHEEMDFFLSGRGLIVLDDETHEVGPHDTLFVPPGVMHQIRNAGTEDLTFLWAYAPSPGAVSESRFLAGARPVSPPSARAATATAPGTGSGARASADPSRGRGRRRRTARGSSPGPRPRSAPRRGSAPPAD